jgi:hypothetical protein
MQADTQEGSAPKSRFGRKRIIILAGVIIVVGTALSGWLFLLPRTPAAVVKAAHQVSFPVYYPGQLPSGYVLDESAVSSTSEAVVFSVKNTITGNQLVVSEQAKPPQFDFDDFYRSQMSKVDHIATSVGDGATGSAGEWYMGSVVTNRSWIIIKGPTTAGDQIKEFLLKLRAM